MPDSRILIIGDEPEYQREISVALIKRSFEVSLAMTGEKGLAAAVAVQPDLIILDLGTPGADGVYTCQAIRNRLLTPIILLWDPFEETDAILGLGVGGDCCLSKPIKSSVLLAQVDAVLRRNRAYNEQSRHLDVLHIKDLTLDLPACELKRAGIQINLSQTEFKLIKVLIENAGRVVTRDQLLDLVWEIKADGVYSRTIDVHIGRLRRKIGDDSLHPQYIFTVPGLGYKMQSS